MPNMILIWVVGVVIAGAAAFAIYTGSKSEPVITGNIVTVATSTATSTPVVKPVVTTPTPPVVKPPAKPAGGTGTTVTAATTATSTTTTSSGNSTTTVTTVTTMSSSTTTGDVIPPQPASVATTLVVAPLPLLQGGTARAGASIPISYLQITNIGNQTAHLKGFWVKQNGSALTASVASLNTVDDKGLIRRNSISTPFSSDGAAFAPTDALLAPGQMRIFTIKAVMVGNVAPYIGTQLMIDVTSIDTNAVTVQGAFPIRGTTWTIGY